MHILGAGESRASKIINEMCESSVEDDSVASKIIEQQNSDCRFLNRLRV
jgi:hypothetical protein